MNEWKPETGLAYDSVSLFSPLDFNLLWKVSITSAESITIFFFIDQQKETAAVGSGQLDLVFLLTGGNLL